MQKQHYQYSRITIDPEICFGKPCIRGMRMPVASILAYLGSGMTFQDVLKEFPYLEIEDIYQALAFSSSFLEDRIIPFKNAA
jgi:uncharacterized protein (DUF433 family)